MFYIINWNASDLIESQYDILPALQYLLSALGFLNPKSIFSKPALSTELSNWVTYKSESFAVVTGT
jgi:hypothetical protein